MTNRSRGALPAVVTAACALALVLVPAGAVARQTADDVRVAALAGVDGYTRPGAPGPLTVTIESAALLDGTIVVSRRGPSGFSRTEVPVQVPGASRKVIHLLVPDATGAEVSVVAGGRTRARTTASTTSLGIGEQLVGLLSARPADRTRVPVPPVGDAPLVAVDQEVLDLGGEALRGLTHLVIDADAGATMSPGQREAVLTFVAGGGALVVAAANEQALAFLPAPWRGTGGGDVRVVPVGTSSVTVALEPFGSPGWRGDEMWRRTMRAVDLDSRQSLSSGRWVELLGTISSFRREALAWLLVFLLGYAATAGPVNFIVLARMGRRELAWVTIPALALLCAGGAYVVGGRSRDVPIVQGAGIMLATPEGQTSTIVLGVLSRSGGSESIELPDGWIVEPGIQNFGAQVNLGTVRPGRDRVDTVFDLPAGGVGALVARGTSLQATPSAGTLSGPPRRLTGEVRNVTPFALEGAAVYVGGAWSSLGSLAVGATSPVQIDATGAVAVAPFQAWEDGTGFLIPGDQTAEEAQARSVLLRQAVLAGGLARPGTAFLIGFVDIEEVAEQTGLPRARGSLLVMTPLTTRVGGNENLPPALIRGVVVRHDGKDQQEQGFALPTAGVVRQAIIRFDLPAGAKPRTLRFSNALLDFSGILPRSVPFPRPPPPDIVVREDGTRAKVILRGGPDVDGSPVVVGGGAGTIEVFDRVAGTWGRSRTLQGKPIDLGASRFVSATGEVLVRVRWDFPTTLFGVPLSLETIA